MAKQKMSPELKAAMYVAAIDLECLKVKILAGVPLTVEEAERLLNENWQVYLFALVDKDIEEAKETIKFIESIEDYLWVACDYLVVFSDGRYHVE